MLASLPESCNRVNAVGAIVRLEGGNTEVLLEQQNSAKANNNSGTCFRRQKAPTGSKACT